MAVTSLPDFFKSDKTITDFTQNGICSECGNCCTNLLPMSNSEIRRIKIYVKKHHIKPHKICLPLAAPTVDATCPFLKTDVQEKRCMIYPVRPMMCRYFLCCMSKSEVAANIYDKETIKERHIPRDVRQTFFSKP